MGKRAVTANGKRIRELRELKGWTPGELADACHLDVRTIRTAEAGKGVDVSSLGSIADSLDVEVSEIIAINQKRATVIITTSINFSNFGEDEQKAFIAMIKRYLPHSGDLDITDVSFGSTIITLEMDQEDVQALRAIVMYAVVYEAHSRVPKKNSSALPIPSLSLNMVNTEVLKIMDSIRSIEKLGIDQSHLKELLVIKDIKELPHKSN